MILKTQVFIFELIRQWVVSSDVKITATDSIQQDMIKFVIKVGGTPTSCHDSHILQLYTSNSGKREGFLCLYAVLYTKKSNHNKQMYGRVTNRNRMQIQIEECPSTREVSERKNVWHIFSEMTQ